MDSWKEERTVAYIIIDLQMSSFNLYITTIYFIFCPIKCYQYLAEFICFLLAKIIARVELIRGQSKKCRRSDKSNFTIWCFMEGVAVAGL